MINPYILFAGIAMFFVAIAYIIRFAWVLGYPLAEEADVWGQFGDYIGGSLSPILNFITILLLIKSLNLQNQANTDLRDEVAQNRHTERIRAFSNLFFNMIASQKALLDGFSINATPGDQLVKPGASSIIYLEDQVEQMRFAGASAKDVTDFLTTIDVEDKIFGILRAFYITVKIVSDKLADQNGFSIEDRKDHLLTLINFTDFAQLRLVILAIQFNDYPIGEYLRKNGDFNVVLREVGLQLDPY